MISVSFPYFLVLIIAATIEGFEICSNGLRCTGYCCPSIPHQCCSLSSGDNFPIPVWVIPVFVIVFICVLITICRRCRNSNNRENLGERQGFQIGAQIGNVRVSTYPNYSQEPHFNFPPNVGGCPRVTPYMNAAPTNSAPIYPYYPQNKNPPPYSEVLVKNHKWFEFLHSEKLNISVTIVPIIHCFFQLYFFLRSYF